MSTRSNILAKLLNGPRKSVWMRRARRLLAAKKFNDAAVCCEMTLDLTPDCEPAKELLLEVREAALRYFADSASEELTLADEMEAVSWCVEADMIEEAATHLTRALLLHAQESPGAEPPPELMLARGQVSFLEGFHARAIEELRKVPASGFMGSESAYYAGLAHMAMGNTAECVRHLCRLVSKHPWFVAQRLNDLLEQHRSAAA